MAGYWLLGATLAFAAAVQPGPLLAFLIAQTLTHGWRRTLPAAFAPVLSDLPIVLLALLVLTQIPPALIPVLQLVGGGYLLYLALGAFRTFRNYRTAAPEPAGSVRRTVLKAVLVNLLNPNPYLTWTLVLGPLLLQAWEHSPFSGATMLAAFYTTMVITTASILAIFSKARSLGPRAARALVGVSAVALGCFGCWQIASGIASVAGR